MAEKENDEEKKSPYGEANYKSKGSPMFTKLWSFEELELVERPERPGTPRRGRNLPHKDVKRPDNWPDDTEVEPGEWVYWLPEGWMQGIRTQKDSGKKLSCYMMPSGKRYWHKKDIEKVLGRVLPVIANPRKEEEAAGSSEGDSKSAVVKYVTDPDAIPNWPDDEEDWLPRDFKVAYRQLPTGLHRVYVPPGKDDEGFLYHRSTVMGWLAGSVTNLTSFGTSKPQVERSAEAAQQKAGKSRKRPASPEDFEEVSNMEVLRLGAINQLDALKRAKVKDAERLASDAQKLQQILSSRRFSDTSLLYVFQRGEQHPVTVYVAGFYYKRPGTLHEKDAYQKICLASDASAGVACSALHLCWSTVWQGHWKIGHLHEEVLGKGYLAFCSDSSMQSGWKLPKASLLKRDAGAPPSKMAKTE